MQIKRLMRYYSMSHFGYRKVELHFKDRLPAEWQSVVAFACFPQGIGEGHLLAFRQCYDRDPDLTLEILSYARQCLASCDDQKLGKQSNQCDRVRLFLLNHQFDFVVRAKDNNGQNIYRLPTKAEVKEWYDRAPSGPRTFKPVPVSKLEDGEIAQVLGVTTASVHTERQALSWTKVEKGKLRRRVRCDPPHQDEYIENCYVGGKAMFSPKGKR